MHSLGIALLVAVVAPSDFPSPQQAEADLAAGTPKYVVSSGAAGRPPLSPQVDQELGLPIDDTGCIPVADRDYNDIVRAWVKAHGLPPNSLKPRFVAAADANKALERAKPVAKGKSATFADGLVVSLEPNSALRFTARGAPPVEFWGVSGEVQVAVDGTRAFVRVRAGDAAFVLHVDLAAKKLLQRF